MNIHVTYSKFLEHVGKGEVASAVVTAPSSGPVPVTARLRDGRSVEALLPPAYQPALALMEQKQIDIDIVAGSPSLWNATPFALLVIVWVILMFRFKGRWPSSPLQGKN